MTGDRGCGPAESEALVDRGVGEADHLQRLWSPHRLSYITESPRAEDGPYEPFTDIPKMTDEEGLVVARGEFVYAVLNLYPYNPGHLMVVPQRHVGELHTGLVQLGQNPQFLLRPPAPPPLHPGDDLHPANRLRPSRRSKERP